MTDERTRRLQRDAATGDPISLTELNRQREREAGEDLPRCEDCGVRSEHVHFYSLVDTIACYVELCDSCADGDTAIEAYYPCSECGGTGRHDDVSPCMTCSGLGSFDL